MRKLALILLLTGCAAPFYSLRRQVTYDKDCPTEKVKVVEWDASIRAAKVMACGNEYKYRDVANYIPNEPISPIWIQVVPPETVQVK